MGEKSKNNSNRRKKIPKSKSKREELEKLANEASMDLEQKDNLPAQVDESFEELKREVAKFMESDVVNATQRVYTDKIIVKQWMLLLEYVKYNPDVIFKGQYYEDNTTTKLVPWTSIKRSYARESELAKRIRSEVEYILETRIKLGAMKNKLNTVMSIFLLKNNYGYVDKREHDMTISDKFKYTIPTDDIEDIDFIEDGEDGDEDEDEAIE